MRVVSQNDDIRSYRRHDEEGSQGIHSEERIRGAARSGCVTAHVHIGVMRGGASGALIEPLYAWIQCSGAGVRARAPGGLRTHGHGRRRAIVFRSTRKFDNDVITMSRRYLSMKVIDNVIMSDRLGYR